MGGEWARSGGGDRPGGLSPEGFEGGTGVVWRVEDLKGGAGVGT